MKPPWVWAVAAQVWRRRWCELSRSCLTSFQLGPGFTCGQPGRRQQCLGAAAQHHFLLPSSSVG